MSHVPPSGGMADLTQAGYAALHKKPLTHSIAPPYMSHVAVQHETKEGSVAVRKKSESVETVDVGASAAEMAGAVTATVQAAQEAAQEAVTRNVEQAVSYTKEQVEKMSKQMITTYDDVAAFTKDNMDALMASSTILARGFEDLSKELSAFTKASLEHNMATAKAMLGAKTLREVVDMQAEFARTSFDTLVAEATKLSEHGVKMTTQAIEPLSARVNAAMEKASKARLAA